MLLQSYANAQSRQIVQYSHAESRKEDYVVSVLSHWMTAAHGLKTFNGGPKVAFSHFTAQFINLEC